MNRAEVSCAVRLLVRRLALGYAGIGRAIISGLIGALGTAPRLWPPPGSAAPSGSAAPPGCGASPTGGGSPAVETRDRRVVIEVTDQGAGFVPEEVPPVRYGLTNSRLISLSG